MAGPEKVRYWCRGLHCSRTNQMGTRTAYLPSSCTGHCGNYHRQESGESWEQWRGGEEETIMGNLAKKRKIWSVRQCRTKCHLSPLASMHISPFMQQQFPRRIRGRVEGQGSHVHCRQQQCCRVPNERIAADGEMCCHFSDVYVIS